jgi:hypothetical protein
MYTASGVPGELERAAPGQAFHEGMMLLLPGVQDPPEFVHFTCMVALPGTAPQTLLTLYQIVVHALLHHAN